MVHVDDVSMILALRRHASALCASSRRGNPPNLDITVQAAGRIGASLGNATAVWYITRAHPLTAREHTEFLPLTGSVELRLVHVNRVMITGVRLRLEDACLRTHHRAAIEGNTETL